MSASHGEDWDSFINRMISLENMNTALIEAGDALANHIMSEILSGITDYSALEKAVSDWRKVKESVE